MGQYVAYAKLITTTNRRRSDGTPLEGRHGLSSPMNDEYDFVNSHHWSLKVSRGVVK